MAARKTIFITGGASGIGRAVALKFAAEGWFVGLGDVDELGMTETQGLIANGFTYAEKLDVRDRAAWDRVLETFIIAAGGQLNCLFNNAGIPLGGPLAECSTEEIDRCIDINLRGVFYGAQAAHPWLVKSAPDACLLNTASAAGIYGTPGASVYSATKFGVRALTESLDAEWFESGIKVRSLMPGFIDTPLLEHNPNARANHSVRQSVTEGGLEITPVENVAEAAWAAVNGDRLHTTVGKTAKSLAFAARWMPGKLRKRVRGGRAMG